MLLLVGLGNPGPAYAQNRHNIGLMAVGEIVRHHSFAPFRRRVRLNGEIADGRLGSEKVIALRPATFMNESGLAVGATARFFKVAPGEIIVFHDELDLAPGKLRVKLDGGNAGHNGLESVDAHIGRDYRRVRLGIGHPGDKDLVTSYVLHDFAADDRPWLERLLDAVAEAFPLLAEGDDNGFMTRVALLAPPPASGGPAPSGPGSAPETGDGV